MRASWATPGIYAAIAGTGWLWFGQVGIGTAAWGVALLLLWLAVRAAVTTDPAWQRGVGMEADQSRPGRYSEKSSPATGSADSGMS
jgi:hypothetical protein